MIFEAPLTLTLILTNIIAFIVMRYNPEIFNRFAESPYDIVHNKRYYQIVTSAFLHVDWMHLLFNMFTLFSFGTYLEIMFARSTGMLAGTVDYGLIYLISLLCGSVLTVILNYKNPSYLAVGASGAVSGIVFSYVLFNPFAMIMVFFVPMPAFVFAFLYVGISIYGMKTKMGNIGHEAHLGGAVGGVIATLILIKGAFDVLIGHF
ncbi:MAG: rhomboid family intramembrane serine protease [Ignavibacteria bacterium]|nr:rhomboid family intramembrane serine protease [Ignavibacteria bacterium]